jgi:hypothetical protein
VYGCWGVEKGSYHTPTGRLGEAEFAQIGAFLDLKNAEKKGMGPSVASNAC